MAERSQAELNSVLIKCLLRVARVVSNSVSIDATLLKGAGTHLSETELNALIARFQESQDRIDDLIKMLEEVTGNE